jgi:hypothetical protein
MKNWKSTLIGAALAGADVFLNFLSNPAFDLTDWKTYVRPLLFAFLGYVVADARKSVQLIGLLLVCSFMLPSCGMDTTFVTPYGDATVDAKGHVVVTPRAKVLEFDLRSSK